jgi:carboxypeptidase family protein/TonB-dependent receptor-like protein
VRFVEPRVRFVRGLLALLLAASARAEAPAIEGVVRDELGAPVAGAELELVPSDREGASLRARTGPDGRFRVEAPAGTYALVASALSLGSTALSVTLPAPAPLVVTLRASEKSESYTVTARRARQALVERSVGVEELQRIPGTQGDALKVVQNLPGAARAPFGLGALVLRGAAPRDSKVFVDGIEVPQLFHFGGLVSVYNSDMIEAIHVYPGGFGVRYGRTDGGLVEVESRRAARDGAHGALDVNFIDATGLLQGPVSERWALAGAVRRSYIDAILAAVLPESQDTDLTLAPRYYDYQARADAVSRGGGSVWSLKAFGSDDGLEFVRQRPQVLLPEERDAFSTHTYFHRLVADWSYAASPTFSSTLTPYIGLDQVAVRFREHYVNQKRGLLGLREEVVAGPGERQLRLGIDALAAIHRMEATLSRLSVTGEINPDEPLDVVGSDTRALGDVAAYAELRRRWRPWLETVAGLRASGHTATEELTLDPRLTVREPMGEATTLQESVGTYHQAPTEAELDPRFGNPDLDSSWALQTSAGVERRLPWRSGVEATAFSNFFFALAVPAGGRGELGPAREIFAPQIGTLGRQVNDGRGRSYGLELLLRRDPGGRFHGWLAYTLMRSERREHPGEPYHTFVFDQRHILTLLGTVRLGRGFEAGARFRLISGNPYAPVTDSYFNADFGDYVRVYGEPFSARLPMFHQLDLRLDKTWRFRTFAIDAYLDVQNVYYHSNPEAIIYNYDATQTGYVRGLPILPSFGVKGWF